MSKEKYNGWYSYQTWLVALWLDNEHGSYSYLREEKENYTDAEDFGEFIKEYIDEFNPLDGSTTVFTDLLNSALSQVDWTEIAENIMNE